MTILPDSLLGRVTPEISSKATPSRSTVSFATVLDGQSSASDRAEAPNFADMTRQELFDWMNGQIRAGKMSLDESTPFLGLTLKISAATGAPVEMATDSERIDFVKRTRLGIDGALSLNNLDEARRLQRALQVMLQESRG